MLNFSRILRPAIITFSLLYLFPLFAVGQNFNDKKSLTHDVYDSWKSIVSPEISADGKWISFLETPQDGDAFIVVKNLVTGAEFKHLIGYSGEGTDAEKAAKSKFSYNSSHNIFLISPSKAEIDSLKKSKKNKNKKAVKKLGVMDLSIGEISVIDSVKSYAMPEEAGGWLAYLKEAKPDTSKNKKKGKKEEEEEEEGKSDDKKKEKDKKDGTTLILQNLDSNEKITVDFVTDFRFTKNGKYLLYIISNKEKSETDGVYSYSLENKTPNPLLTGEGNYKKWSFDKNETRLAFFTDRDDYDSDPATFNLYGWNVGDKKATKWISHQSTKGFPEGMSVSDKSSISFSDDGNVVMFGIKEIPEPEKDDSLEVEKDEAKFDLWHWNDPYPQPQQKRIAKRVRDNTWESVYFIKKNKFVKLADEKMPDVNLSRNGNYALSNNIWSYTKLVSFDASYYDVYLVDTKNGNRTLVKKKLHYNGRLSPNEKYIYWFEHNNWFVYNVKKRSTKNVTASLNVRFELEDWDTPTHPRPYGIAGWTDNDKSILIYDRFDIWEINPDGLKARRITEGFGRDKNISFRYVKLDPDKQTISPNEILLLHATNEETMASGFYNDTVNGTAEPKKLIMADKNFSRRSIKKAKKADTIIFSRSAFDEYPDLWNCDLSFNNPSKITSLGDQMETFIWGKAELRDFTSSDGKPLKGILIKPDNFDPNKKYPLMVYIYETLHSRFHSYRNPSPGSSINPSYYVSNGYILWMPDIEYDTGYPGKDALKCVLPGIQMLLREGYIDDNAIGIQGHSWGGYQIAYMITQTNIFAAAEAGAPVSNMISAYGGIRWASGMVRQFQYEHTQSRLGNSLWEVPLRYIENSPIFWADKVQTPLLMMHNDEDGAVPWYQGIEYMMALRRLEKEAYMFNYNGEKHGLRKRVNQMDWTVRLAEFFDHHLKNAPAPKWMTDGIKAWEKKDKEKEK